MNNSGDAAEQVVRLSLEGTEVALKLTGSAAKNIAAAIYAVLKNRDKNKIKGRQRLTAMLKSGKELRFCIRFWIWRLTMIISDRTRRPMSCGN